MREQGLVLFFWLLTISAAWAQASTPDGFRDELVIGNWNDAVGIEFIDSMTWLVYERTGRVWVVESGLKRTNAIIDLSREVLGSGDHGLVGFALHPQFDSNRKVYLSYVVDPWVIRHPGQEPDSLEVLDQWNATIGRIIELTLDLSTNQVLPNSRRILIGQDLQSGIPVLAPAHGVGGLAFGHDGSLLIATGDGTTWVGFHTGGEDYKQFGYDSLGKADGIIEPWEDVGSYRAQLIESYSGKILRIDPESGQGLPDNPFYQIENPASVQSKVWAMGLRNPFRIRVAPVNGARDHGPGTLVIGDVGSNQFEEINVAVGPAQNFGWPSYEGFEENTGYTSQQIVHPFQEGINGCDQPFTFEQLLIRQRADHQKQLLNACTGDLLEQLPLYASTHSFPSLAYGNSKNRPNEVLLPAEDLTTGFIEGRLVDDLWGSENSFSGISSIVGDYYVGSGWPTNYQDMYIHADFEGWIRTFTLEVSTGAITASQQFAENVRPPVYVRYNPYDECMYYLVLDYRDQPFPRELRRICFGGDAAPVARFETSTQWGYAPLEVNLTAADSYDPEGEEISFHWIIDTDTILAGTDTSLIFDEIGIRNIPVTLMVTDPAGNTGISQQVISLNNTPPQVVILSPDDGLTYAESGEILSLSLRADANDAEHSQEELSYCWRIFLDHNTHTHLETEIKAINPSLNLQTTPETPFDTYSYRIQLEVSDPLGLVTQEEVTLYPRPVAIEDKLRPLPYRLFPNPTSTNVIIQSDGGFIQDVVLLSMNGVVLSRSKVNSNEINLDLTSQSSGIYIVKISDDRHPPAHLRVIKW